MSGLVGAIAGISEVLRTHPRFDAFENFADSTPERVPGPHGSAPKPMLDLKKGLLDRVQVRTVRRQEVHVRAG